MIYTDIYKTPELQNLSAVEASKILNKTKSNKLALFINVCPIILIFPVTSVMVSHFWPEVEFQLLLQLMILIPSAIVVSVLTSPLSIALQRKEIRKVMQQQDNHRNE